MNFERTSENIMSLLGEIYHTTYLSVILYRSNAIQKIQTNNFNNWENIFFNEGLHKDCLLFKIANSFNEMLPNQEDIIVWDNVVDINDQIHKMRLEHGLHNGISVIIKCANDIAWCISACSDDTQDKEFFHANFHSKKPKIREILRRSNVY